MKRIPIKSAEDYAKANKQEQVIIVSWDANDHLMHVVSYGTTTAACAQAAAGANVIKRALGFPEHLCNTQPARAVKQVAALAEMRAEVERLKRDLASAEVCMIEKTTERDGLLCHRDQLAAEVERLRAEREADKALGRQTAETLIRNGAYWFDQWSKERFRADEQKAEAERLGASQRDALIALDKANAANAKLKAELDAAEAELRVVCQ